ncbi:MAG: hypothetical protein KFF73_05330 [Cyclobacteriaceae bacterium]|nr:hypothetical protein [Cyclobacteriaceae bacterium]
MISAGFQHVHKLFYVFAITIVICSCHDLKDFDQPLIFTGEVTGIDTTGADFYAKIVDLGNHEILEYGFVWDLNPNPKVNDAEKYIIRETPDPGIIKQRITTTLRPGYNYHVRFYF